MAHDTVKQQNVGIAVFEETVKSLASEKPLKPPIQRPIDIGFIGVCGSEKLARNCINIEISQCQRST
ncbi:hypothetical protein BST12_15045 [Mycobacterium angelicum]|uniref:Uncharacterized protein n=1 Tax=Mycobacterium angelicum TaxID=470074 RepID=A0A1W9ZRN0_MYCAN|nr:hypothetical protein BST12_15045 [Mycobacterium angelicum]